MRHAFADRLRTVRASLGISQLRLAQSLGVQQSYVAKWEAAAYNPSESVKEKVARIFRVSPRWLMEGEPPVFTGIVFIPRPFHERRGKFNPEAFARTARLVLADGAEPTVVALNRDRPGEKMVLFSRDDLLLFIYCAHLDRRPPSPAGYPDIVVHLSEAENLFLEGGSQGGRPGSGFGPRVRLLSDQEFSLFSAIPPVDVVERLLAISIPAGLKSAHREEAAEQATVGPLAQAGPGFADSCDEALGPYVHALLKDREDRHLGTMLLSLIAMLENRIPAYRRRALAPFVDDLRRRVDRLCREALGGEPG